MTEQTLDRPSAADVNANEVPQTTSGVAPVADTLSSHVVALSDSSDGEEVDYVPVSPWAPISLCTGLLGLTGFIGEFGLYVAFFGIFIGIGAIRQIGSSGGFVKGKWMAVVGLVLSISSFGLGAAKMRYEYKHEVPEGYQRVNFQNDVAEKQFIFYGGHRKLDPEVAALVGRKVYLKGFMWATQETENLRQFILLKDNGECCMGGKPKSHDYIYIILPKLKSPDDRPSLSNRTRGMSVIEIPEDAKKELASDKDYHGEGFQLVTRAYRGKVAVAGVLQADVRAGEDQPGQPFDEAMVYTMTDVELVEEAWTHY